MTYKSFCIIDRYGYTHTETIKPLSSNPVIYPETPMTPGEHLIHERPQVLALGICLNILVGKFFRSWQGNRIQWLK
jgi:hypothetical protein